MFVLDAPTPSVARMLRLQQARIESEKQKIGKKGLKFINTVVEIDEILQL